MTADRRSVIGALRERWASLLDVTPFSGKEISLALAIAAVGFVATALIAFAGSASRGQPAAVQTVNVPGPTVYVTVTPSAAAVPPVPSASVQPTTPTQRPTTAAPSPVPVQPVWHQGDVTIAPNGGADLDAPRNDLSWGQKANQGQIFTSGGPFDIGWQNSIVAIDPADASGIVLKAKPSYATCPTSGYGTNSGIKLSSLQLGKILCVETSEGRIAAVSYKAMVYNGIIVHITTWAKAGD